jgi:hypothetical protein
LISRVAIAVAVVVLASSCGHRRAIGTSSGAADTGVDLGSPDGPSVIGPLGAWPSSPTVFCTDGRQPTSACPSPGQPAYGQDGNFPKRIPVYSVTSGSVTDSVTGLEWQQVASAPLPWTQAVDLCATSRVGQHADWRLPSARELFSLVDYGRFDPAADPSAFPDALGIFWSSSQQGGNALAVDFADGKPFPGIKDSSNRARCVRGAPLAAMFEPSSDGASILDRSTGLRWARATTSARYRWMDVLLACPGSMGGQADWRVPTIKELATLLGAAGEGPSWATAPGNLWSATPSARYSTGAEDGSPAAWRFDGAFSDLAVALMSGESPVACVRSE